jgi:hypothetical protein
MKPKKHINKFYDNIHRLTFDGHIDSTNKWLALCDVENAVDKLKEAFIFSGEIKDEPPKP